MDRIEGAIRDLFDELGEFSLDELIARLNNGTKSVQLLSFYQIILAENEMRIKVGDLFPNTQKVYKTTLRCKLLNLKPPSN